jgi:hypothetical protein
MVYNDISLLFMPIPDLGKEKNYQGKVVLLKKG